MIGERLRELRKSKEITQEELAGVLKIQNSTISMYESGKAEASDEVKVRIAHYFNVSVDYLIGVIDEEVNYYHKKSFLKLPKDITEEEENLLNDFAKFISYRRMIVQ